MAASVMEIITPLPAICVAMAILTKIPVPTIEPRPIKMAPGVFILRSSSLFKEKEFNVCSGFVFGSFDGQQTCVRGFYKKKNRTEVHGVSS